MMYSVAVYPCRSHVVHGRMCSVARLVGFVLDQGDNHAVQVEEEHDQVEAKLGE